MRDRCHKAVALWPICLSAMSFAFVFAFIAPFAVHAGMHEVFLGRNAVADVASTNGEWCITVAFDPSRALGPSKSDIINQRLARDYALRGLARELCGPDASISSLSVSNLALETFVIRDGRTTAIFRVPANGVTVISPPQPLVATDGPIAPATNEVFSISNPTNGLLPYTSP